MGSSLAHVITRRMIKQRFSEQRPYNRRSFPLRINCAHHGQKYVKVCCEWAPDLSEAIEVLETYSQVLMDLSNPVEARRMHEEAQRIRAAKAFTVRANQAK